MTLSFFKIHENKCKFIYIKLGDSLITYKKNYYILANIIFIIYIVLSN